MIAIAALVLVLLVLATVPWGRLPTARRIWAAGSVLNTLVFVGVPTVAATSSWRPIVDGVLFGSVAISLALFMVGVYLRRRHAAAAGGPVASAGR